MSALTIMATALDQELQRRAVFHVERRGIFNIDRICNVSRDDCEAILRTVIDHAVALAATYETSHPGPLSPPSGRVLDGGRIAPGDAPAVPSDEDPSWTAYLDGAGEP